MRKLLLAIGLLVPALAFAQVPQAIHYQGYLTNAAGVPENGSKSIVFSLYSAASGGSALWTETQASVQVTSGNYGVILGSGTPLTLPFNAQYYLGVKIGADAEMTPRQALAASPYAFRAASSDALAGTATVQGSQITGTITGATISGGMITDATITGGTLAQLDGRYGQAANVQPPQANTLTAVDTAGSVGFDTSITIGADGLPVISYYDSTNGDLKVAKCGNPVCSAGNTPIAVDTAGNVGWYTSITIGADGLPVISYQDNTNLDLKVAKCGNPACSAGNTLTAVDTVGNVGLYTSITIGADGLPVIAYYDNTNFDLKVAKCGNSACSAGNTLTAVDTVGNVGLYPSIVIPVDGLPVISYRDETNGDLKVAKCSNAACTGIPVANTLTAVDTAGNVGEYTSITIGADGLPVISYFDNTNDDLKVAKCGNPACSAGNTLTAVDTAGDVGWYTSITIGSDGLPVISYFDPANTNLKVAKCGNLACSAGNTITPVDTAGSVGFYTSITIGADGLPVISYAVGGSADLKVAKCANAFCVPYFRRR